MNQSQQNWRNRSEQNDDPGSVRIHLETPKRTMWLCNNSKTFFNPERKKKVCFRPVSFIIFWHYQIFHALVAILNGPAKSREISSLTILAMGKLPNWPRYRMGLSFLPAFVHSLHTLTEEKMSRWMCGHQKSNVLRSVSSRPGCPQWNDIWSAVRRAFGTTERLSMYKWPFGSRKKFENFARQGAGSVWTLCFFWLLYQCNNTQEFIISFINSNHHVFAQISNDIQLGRKWRIGNRLE